MKLPFLKSIKPKRRPRDDKYYTHVLQVSVCEEEAILLSDFLQKSTTSNGIGFSLIRAFLLRCATGDVSIELLAEMMAKVKTITTLADTLSQSDCAKAIGLLEKSKVIKKDLPKKNIRVFIP